MAQCMEEKLIEEVKQHEILYKKSSLAYRNKLKRAAAWKSIADKLNIPENVCQARWKTLRDRYVKKHAETHHASGSGAELQENPWRYYQQMEFLREHIKPRKQKRSRKENNDEAFKEFLGKMEKIAEARFGATQTETAAHEGFFSMVREIFQDLPKDVVNNAKFFFLDYLHKIQK